MHMRRSVSYRCSARHIGGLLSHAIPTTPTATRESNPTRARSIRMTPLKALSTAVLDCTRAPLSFEPPRSCARALGSAPLSTRCPSTVGGLPRRPRDLCCSRNGLRRPVRDPFGSPNGLRGPCATAPRRKTASAPPQTRRAQLLRDLGGLDRDHFRSPNGLRRAISRPQRSPKGLGRPLRDRSRSQNGLRRPPAIQALASNSLLRPYWLIPSFPAPRFGATAPPPSFR